MAIKVKEIKDDVIISIQVNKNFYNMVKAASYYLITTIQAENKSAYIQETTIKPYQDLDDLQRSFYTLALLVAEIESKAKFENHYIEKEVLEPGDEGYVAPKLN
jgi:adenosine deaminase